LKTIKHLVVITTGGTIDKVYFDALSRFQVAESQVGLLLNAVGASFAVSIVRLLRKDSLDLTDRDRALIRKSIAAQSEVHILVTHGTDTMVETAIALQGIRGKTIVLTGALNPACVVGSDATFNIGVAVGALPHLPAGVYVCMNGRLFDPMRVHKNRERHCFEDLPAPRALTLGT
jgi:L-asparaginase